MYQFDFFLEVILCGFGQQLYKNVVIYIWRKQM